MQEAIFEEFAQKVCRAEAAIAVQVYLELLEVKRYYIVDYSYNENINKIVITGKKRKENELCAFIPVTSYEKMDFMSFQTYINATSCPTTILVIVGNDSTTVYYQISNDLILPEDTSAKHLREDKRMLLDKELEKNRRHIEDAALLGIPVTFPRKPGTSSDSSLDSCTIGQSMEISKNNFHSTDETTANSDPEQTIENSEKIEASTSSQLNLNS